MDLKELRPFIIYESDHWDVPLAGLARIDGRLHSFHASEWPSDDELYPTDYNVTPLTGYAKLKALAGKRWFEIAVGTHWSYDRKTRDYHPNRPRWLRHLLWWLYYRQVNPLLRRKH